MSKTKVDIRNLILKNMGVLAAGETASAEDASDVEEMIDLAHATLRERGIALWDVDLVPDEVSLPLAQFVSGLMRDTDFVAAGKEQSIATNMVIGIEELFRLTSIKATSSPVKAEYF